MFVDVNPLRETLGAKLTREGRCDFTEWQQSMTPLVVDPVDVEVTAVNSQGSLLLEIHAKYVLQLECDRCAEPYSVSHDEHFSHVVDGTENADGDPVSSEDGIVEIDPLLWDDILSTIPFRRFCREDCKGLCLNCGANLNLGPCGCEHPHPVTIGD